MCPFFGTFLRRNVEFLKIEKKKEFTSKWKLLYQYLFLPGTDCMSLASSALIFLAWVFVQLDLEIEKRMQLVWHSDQHPRTNTLKSVRHNRICLS